MGLDYDYPEREKACATKPLKVKLDGKHVGEIRKVKDGYQYYAKGEKKGGELFSRVSEVQNSLLCTQPTRDNKKQNPQGDSTDEIIKQAKAGIKKLEKDLEFANQWRESAETLLCAAVDLLTLQKESKETINLLEESVNYNGTDCDGHSLIEDIVTFTD